MSITQWINPAEAGTPVLRVVGLPTRNGPTWVWVEQDLDLASAAAVHAELTALLTDVTAPGSVLVYLGAECFVDVRGMRLLVDAARQARRRGGDLAVVAPPPCLRRMVTRVGVGDELVLIADTREAARWARTRRRV